MTENVDVDIAAKHEEVSGARALAAESLIKNYVIGSVAAAAVPVPMFDIAAVSAIQLRMIQKLSELYDQPFSEKIVRSIMSSLAGGVVGYGVGATTSSLLKVVPGIGWLAGFAALPAMAGAATYALGKVFANHFEDGRALLDFDMTGAQELYNKQLKRGKKVVSGVMGKKGEAAEAA